MRRERLCNTRAKMSSTNEHSDRRLLLSNIITPNTQGRDRDAGLDGEKERGVTNRQRDWSDILFKKLNLMSKTKEVKTDNEVRRRSRTAVIFCLTNLCNIYMGKKNILFDVCVQSLALMGSRKASTPTSTPTCSYMPLVSWATGRE